MNRAAFFAALRKRESGLFGTSLTQAQVDGISGILDAFGTHGDGRRATLAYALATAYHETGRRMVPVREGFAKTDAGARAAVAKLAKQRGPNSAPARYGVSTPPYGHAYYGRGHVQLTWQDNYKRASVNAGVDLVKNPDAMLDPIISARVLIVGLVLGWWGPNRLAHYELSDGKPGLSPQEAKEARRTVNVQDKAELIAGYYRAFDAALVAAGVGHVTLPQEAPAKPASAPPVHDAAPAAPTPAAKPQGLLAGLMAWLRAMGWVK
jgi:hypothetical protein